MAKILILDNYDSFTYNLVHYVKDYDKHDVDVFRNDQISLEDVDSYDGIILSPGPGLPAEAGLLLKIIENYYESKRIFGVCLGLQAIGEVFSGKLINLSKVHHGVATKVKLLEPRHYLFEGLPDDPDVGRYHSWVVDPKTFPNCLRITAVDAQGEIMALEHKEYDVCGVQFHPESILTPQGKEIVFNWLKRF
jgi:anthranilate synthase component II